MQQRINVLETEPTAYKAMLGLEAALTQSSLSKNHLNLIKVRASQINGCAFCINMHTKEAKAHGETEQRLFMLDAWEETTLYSPEERAILKLTEEITNIQGKVSDETYSYAEELLGKNYLALVIMAAVTINAWNRIAISTRLQPQ